MNVWIPAAVLALLTFAATARLSLLPAAPHHVPRWMKILTNSIWLLPLMLAMALTLGLMAKGVLSPWPPQAAAYFETLGGGWAALTGFVLVLTVDMWLLWTGSRIVLRHTPLEDRHAIRHLSALNLLLGGGLLVAIYFMRY